MLQNAGRKLHSTARVSGRGEDWIFWTEISALAEFCTDSEYCALNYSYWAQLLGSNGKGLISASAEDRVGLLARVDQQGVIGLVNASGGYMI